ncbi:hypothetical protein RRG08_007611 [Elysia crispata]|uniref:Uncharacterized protein n=1 Tax=Elysia crispata TaxID=231223 RepID=A0AAE1AK99_9GAST|nr:hypothetical protein RRG08_007611 [Elysia crispata]
MHRSNCRKTEVGLLRSSPQWMLDSQQCNVARSANGEQQKLGYSAVLPSGCWIPSNVTWHALLMGSSRSWVTPQFSPVHAGFPAM